MVSTKSLVGFILLMFSLQIKAQHKTPGGILSPAIWFITDTIGRTCFLKSQIPGLESLPKQPHDVAWMNNYPALIMDGLNTITTKLGAVDIHKATFFTVFHLRDTTKENLLWTIGNSEQTDLVFTSHRMADLKNTKYMNFTDLDPTAPKISVYQQFVQKDSTAVFDLLWKIGMVPVTPKLPVTNFKGLLPELIVYNRLLNKEERLKVATYLALKYGITLSESDGMYLNSSGQIIWKGTDLPIYHHHVAGLGRDDASGLNLLKSSSSSCTNLLTVSTDLIKENNHFLIWGDNAGTLTYAPKQSGMPVILNRKWLVRSFGESSMSGTKLKVDTKQLFSNEKTKPVYWLAIDHSGKGEFSKPDIQYIKMDNLDEHGFASFTVAWPSKTRSVFSIVVGQDLFLSTTIVEPKCGLTVPGRLETKIVGGHPPYVLNMSNEMGLRFSQSIFNVDSSIVFENLKVGKYILRVTDNKNQVYMDSFYINHADMPLALSLKESYWLENGRILKINASEGMPTGVSYQWRGPHEFKSNNNIIEAIHAGTYFITSTYNGCIHTKEIKIFQSSTEIFTSEIMYPNPSSGEFQIKMQLNRVAEVKMSIYTSEGKLITTRKVTGSDHYIFTHSLAANGLYYIVLQSGDSMSTSKLLIIN